MRAAWLLAGLVGAACTPDRVATVDDVVQGAEVAGHRSMRSHQWHLESLAAGDGLKNPGRWVVAVLDTGVAYGSAVRGGVRYVPAPTLSGSRIVAPADFVNHDAEAFDDHQHGTHVASLIASDGEVQGVAPGVSLMPVKVLDHTNSGTEDALIAGIRHAIDHGADVINMSLTLGPEPPSKELLDVLRDAWQAGIVMVSASGNEGASRVTWPAASPWVIAVGASVADETGAVRRARYTNHSAALDVLAPGGDLTVDRDHDGFVDGLLAESIQQGDPSHVSFWLMAGTSQAAALTSGVAVHLLDDGLSPSEVVSALRNGRAPGLVAAGQ